MRPDSLIDIYIEYLYQHLKTTFIFPNAIAVFH